MKAIDVVMIQPSRLCVIFLGKSRRGQGVTRGSGERRV